MNNRGFSANECREAYRDRIIWLLTVAPKMTRDTFDLQFLRDVAERLTMLSEFPPEFRRVGVQVDRALERLRETGIVKRFGALHTYVPVEFRRNL